MSNGTKIDSADGLINWCRDTHQEVKIQRKGAAIIMDYLLENGKELSASSGGELFFLDKENPITLDDVVDLVCEWNYEKLVDARDKKENPKNFIDFCSSSSLEKQLEEKQTILDRIFSQTVYGKDAEAIAHDLARKTMKRLKLIPVIDIPMLKETGVYGRETALVDAAPAALSRQKSKEQEEHEIREQGRSR